MTLAPDRPSLVDLLARWTRGELTAWQMVEEAEEAEEAMLGDAAFVPEIDRANPESIPVAVLELLAMAHQQWVLPDDVPALLAFLEAPAGSEIEAWSRFDQYWELVDFSERESRARELFGKASI